MSSKSLALLTIGLLSGFTIALREQARANPDVRNMPIFYSSDGSQSWQLITDDQNPSLYYRLPDYFSVVPTPDGLAGVTASREPDGALRLSLTWGPRDWTGEADALRTAIMRKTSHEPTFAVIFPELAQFTLDPELTTNFGASVYQEGGDPTSLTPGSTWTTTVIVPRDNEAKFVERVVTGAGFTSLVAMRFRVRMATSTQSEAAYTYTINMFLGGLSFCEVKPEMICQ